MKLQNMQLNEMVCTNANSSYTRVPGGWVYGDMQGCCFVPYSDEYNTGTIKSNPILNKKVQNVLSAGLSNCLRNNEVFLISDILNYTRSDVVRFNNVGRKKLNELICFLDAHNIKW